MKKKNMRIVLAAVVCAVFTGCGSKGTPDVPVISETTAFVTEISTTGNSNSTVTTAATEVLQSEDPSVSNTPDGDALVPTNPEPGSSVQPNESNGNAVTVQTTVQSTGENVVIDSTDADGNLIEPEPAVKNTLVPNDADLEHDEHGFVVF